MQFITRYVGTIPAVYDHEILDQWMGFKNEENGLGNENSLIN